MCPHIHTPRAPIRVIRVSGHICTCTYVRALPAVSLRWSRVGIEYGRDERVPRARKRASQGVSWRLSAAGLLAGRCTKRTAPERGRATTRRYMIRRACQRRPIEDVLKLRAQRD